MAEETASTRARARTAWTSSSGCATRSARTCAGPPLELRDEWKEIERKLPDPAAAAEQLRGATADMAERLVDELRKFRSRLQRKSRRPTATGPRRADVPAGGDLPARPTRWPGP